MIKARACAGDIAAGEAFLHELSPFVWRKYLDFAAIADVQSMKRQIHAVKGHGEIAVLGHNLKLGRGGVFMSCKRYPDCLGARTEEGTELKQDEPIGVHPETGANIYIKTGRFGPYVEMDLPAPTSEVGAPTAIVGVAF